MSKKSISILTKDGVSYLIPFILITSCFALWGFANDITHPMVKAFSKIFRGLGHTGGLIHVHVGLAVGLRHGDGGGVGEHHLGGVGDVAHILGDGGSAAGGDVLGHGDIAVLIQLHGLV